MLHFLNISSLHIIFKVSLLLSLLSDSLALLPKRSYPSSFSHPCGASKEFPPSGGSYELWDPRTTPNISQKWHLLLAQCTIGSQQVLIYLFWLLQAEDVGCLDFYS